MVRCIAVTLLVLFSAYEKSEQASRPAAHLVIMKVPPETAMLWIDARNSESRDRRKVANHRRMYWRST